MPSKEEIKKQIADLEKKRAVAEYALKCADIELKNLRNQCPHEWGETIRGAWDMPVRYCIICGMKDPNT
ncbi:MAG: hypothetical protein V1661_00520 [bacterium]